MPSDGNTSPSPHYHPHPKKRNWTEAPNSWTQLGQFPPCHSVTSTNGFYYPPPSPPAKSGSKLVCNVNIVYGHLKSENSQDNAQKPQRNYTFMNSASGNSLSKKSQSLSQLPAGMSLTKLFLYPGICYLMKPGVLPDIPFPSPELSQNPFESYSVPVRRQ